MDNKNPLTEDEQALVKIWMTDIKLWHDQFSSNEAWAYECIDCGASVGVGVVGHIYNYYRRDVIALKHIRWHEANSWTAAPLA